jgi:hypothetical protein
VISSRADSAACSSERVVVSLGGIRSLQPWSQSGNNQRFHVHKFWWVWDNPSAFRTHSTVLCIEFLFFRKRKKEKNKERGEIALC